MSVTVFSAGFLDELVASAASAPRRRQHRNIHGNYEDPCQRLFNAIGKDSYIQPHRHTRALRPEMLIAVHGAFALVTFNDDGALQEVLRFATEKYGEAGTLPVGVELSPGVWHTVLALTGGAVLLEVKPGPFDPNAAKESPAWAPDECAPEAQAFFESLRALAGTWD